MSPQEDGRQADCIRATLQTLCTLVTSDRPSAQMQLHSEVLGVRTGTYGYGGDTLQSIAPSKAVVRQGPPWSQPVPVGLSCGFGAQRVYNPLFSLLLLKSFPPQVLPEFTT